MRFAFAAMTALTLSLACASGGGGSDCSTAGCPATLACDPATHRCVTPVACGPGVPCAAGFVCVGGQCQAAAGCASDADCLPSGLCDPFAHACASTIACPRVGCPSGWRCVAERCEPPPAGACANDSDCANGASCDGGVCVGCASTGALCADDFVACDAGTNACRACATDGECPANFPYCTAAGCAECRPAADGTSADCPSSRRFCNDRRCVQCMSNADCSTLDQCWAGYCQHSGCTTDADCSSSAPYCDGASGCVMCATDADCPANQACLRSGCFAPRPGETCWNATPLVFTNGRAEVIADAGGYGCPPPRTDDGLPSCGGTMYFQFTLAVQSRVIFTMGWNPVSKAPYVELFANGCAWLDAIFTPTSEADMLVRWLPPGDYTIRVQTIDQTPVTLVALASPIDLPRGMSCLDPIPLALDASGHATATGDMTGHVDVAVNAVDQLDPDAIYAIDLAGPSRVDVTVTPLYQTASQVDVAVKDDCLAPVDTWRNGTFLPVTRSYGPLAAGRHLVVVNEILAYYSGYRLDVQSSPW
jgi:hypothetical protein